MDQVSIEPLWADSLGAKTMCSLVKTPEINVLIDPGVAVMQPSFPASWAKKFYWKARAWLSIKKASRKADVIVISHYHYDHFTDFDLGIYDGKILLAKNPNEYINNSQRDRARGFFEKIYRSLGDSEKEDLLKEPEDRKYGDPLESVPHARDLDLGDYNPRREELLEDWEKTYWKRVEKWKSWKRTPESEFGEIEVRFPEGEELEFGETVLRFTPARFHGIELAKTGWVFSTVIERKGKKFIHASDLQGPTVEDYADWIIEENPDFLYLDGPATYLLGYMLNKTNLQRAAENTARIIENTDAEIILYDHHLTREKKFKERTEKVWKAAKNSDTDVLTVAEYKGKTPVVLE